MSEGRFKSPYVDLQFGVQGLANRVVIGLCDPKGACFALDVTSEAAAMISLLGEGDETKAHTYYEGEVGINGKLLVRQGFRELGQMLRSWDDVAHDVRETYIRVEVEPHEKYAITLHLRAPHEKNGVGLKLPMRARNGFFSVIRQPRERENPFILAFGFLQGKLTVTQ